MKLWRTLVVDPHRIGSRRALVIVSLGVSLAVAGAGMLAASAQAACPPFCINPGITTGYAAGFGIAEGKATIHLRNAFPGNPPLADLCYIEDEDNGQNFAVDDPFFGIPTLVKRGGVVKFEGDKFKLGCAVNFVGYPLILFVRSDKKISIPAILIPCQVNYSIIPALDSAEVGQITVVAETSPIKQLMLSAFDDIYTQLCGPSPAAKLDGFALINLSNGDNSGLLDLGLNEQVRWYNGLGQAVTLNFSTGATLDCPADDYSPPISFPDNAVVTYTVTGFSGAGILQVGTSVPDAPTNWGTVKAKFGGLLGKK
jgi:hypothetical protein